ncbi:lipoate--protein ligase [Aminipila butyrica]|uniref:lipoate--protein ligase n=1 Tax=Aminipila butyrica TaxID=433296 RepID=A0A858BXM2_9FIRM|nr:lipoate--protein ligase [Aminipila butyrica]QIB69835.1 lipoate--protein ligase [Aminipila butyrica]
MHSIYISQSFNPYFNLAFEEYLVGRRRPHEQILYLWQNQNTVVIGRNQNPWKECNLEELNRLGGQLVRRLSGGGAVYHDLGNLNFTFISPDGVDQIHRNMEVILQALSLNGISADFSGKNDILAEGFKISGNAYFLEEDTLCHHGTLLLDVDFEKLSRVLTVSPKKLQSKGIDSVKSRVKNLKEFNNKISLDSLQQDLIQTFTSKAEVWQINQISEEEIQADLPEILELKNRYESWGWSYGSSPEFNVELSEHFPWGEVTLYLTILDGIIEKVTVATDSLNLEVPTLICQQVLHRRFNQESLWNQLGSLFK